jgi:hypothetical protein
MNTRFIPTAARKPFEGANLVFARLPHSTIFGILRQPALWSPVSKNCDFDVALTGTTKKEGIPRKKGQANFVIRVKCFFK